MVVCSCAITLAVSYIQKIEVKSAFSTVIYMVYIPLDTQGNACHTTINYPSLYCHTQEAEFHSTAHLNICDDVIPGH